MFATLAPRLRDNGWASVIPVANPGKCPLISGWQAYNRAAPTEVEVDLWCSAHPCAGIGLAYGPDRVLGVDLDFLDVGTAASAEAAVVDVLGINDCVRIGRSPKRLLLYRAAPGLVVPGKAFGGYELFSTTCQTVLFGTHPDTGQPYYWPARSPEDISPQDLPVATQEALNTLIGALEPLCGRLGRKYPQSPIPPAHGRVAQWLQAFNDPDGKPVDLCRAAVEVAPEGALVRIGLSDAEIITNLILPYLDRFDRREQPARQTAIMSGLRWARQEIGPDAATIADTIRSSDMFARWKARWRHRT
jgi:Bifunctional DNA primase/polymerase, N-terminal